MALRRQTVNCRAAAALTSPNDHQMQRVQQEEAQCQPTPPALPVTVLSASTTTTGGDNDVAARTPQPPHASVMARRDRGLLTSPASTPPRQMRKRSDSYNEPPARDLTTPSAPAPPTPADMRAEPVEAADDADDAALRTEAVRLVQVEGGEEEEGVLQQRVELRTLAQAVAERESSPSLQ